MAVGIPYGKIDIDQRAGNLAKDLRDQLIEIQQFKVWLDSATDQSLQDFTYTAAEITLLRSAFVDLDKLAQIYQGLATQSPAYDFRVFAKRIIGVQ